MNFSNGKFNGGSFVGKNLRHADFTNADLRNADFCQADVTGADFSGADVAGAYFVGAKGAKEALSESQKYWCTMTLDEAKDRASRRQMREWRAQHNS